MFQYAMVAVIFSIGLYCVSAKKNLVKAIFGMIFMEYSCIVLLLLGSRSGLQMQSPEVFATVILATGLASTIVLAALVMRIYNRYGTVDPTEIRKLKG